MHFSPHLYVSMYIQAHVLLVPWECTQKRLHKSTRGRKAHKHCQGQAAISEQRLAINTYFAGQTFFWSSCEKLLQTPLGKLLLV